MPGIEALVVTTSSKTRQKGDAVADAQALAKRLGVPFVPCVKGTPVESLLAEARCVLVLRGDGVVVLDAEGSARWSAGMADKRIARLDTGVEQPDHVLLSGEVREGDHVLDCTLGRAHDALVLARAVGPKGRVVGVESALPLYAWTSAGLERRERGASECAIECVHSDALAYLRKAESRSFDCVFFDPMFSKLALYETGFSLVRRHGEKTAVQPELVAEARRVTRRWVVVKAAPQSTDLRRLGLDVLPFKRSADLRFGRLGPLHPSS